MSTTSSGHDNDPAGIVAVWAFPRKRGRSNDSQGPEISLMDSDQRNGEGQGSHHGAKTPTRHDGAISLLGPDGPDEPANPVAVAPGGKDAVVSLVDSDDDDDEQRKRPAIPLAGRDAIVSLMDDSDTTEGNLEEEEDEIRIALDRIAAQCLQEEEEEDQAAARLERLHKEQREMATSGPGKAVLAVQRILAAVRKAVPPSHWQRIERIGAVAEDDMVYLAEKLLARQQEFLQHNIPARIDIGFHYTMEQNLSKIRTNGLLTQREQNDRKIQSRKKGSVFGDGIYTANNPRSFRNYGTTGLLVGRLLGKAVRVRRSIVRAGAEAEGANTIIGNKLQNGEQLGSDGWPVKDSYDEVVLKDSSQCLPMVRYEATVLDNPDGYKLVSALRVVLQSIVDEVFNGETSREAGSPTTRLGSVVPSPRATHAAAAASSQNAQKLVVAAMPISLQAHPYVGVGFPPNLSWAQGSPLPVLQALRHRAGATHPKKQRTHQSSASRLVYEAPESLLPLTQTLTLTLTGALVAVTKQSVGNEDCVICQDALSKCPCVALKVCDHVFHFSCLEQALRSKRQCPICRKAVGAPQGTSPSGTMSVSAVPASCSGYREATIAISYDVKGGIQKQYHENPGTRHSGKRATAYLPDNPEGRALLKRLKYAFLHGLTFTVGTSLTTGITNQCTWSSIHHKTSLRGGIRAHGFPDPAFFRNCNEELDAVGVPSSMDLLPDGRSAV